MDTECVPDTALPALQMTVLTALMCRRDYTYFSHEETKKSRVSVQSLILPKWHSLDFILALTPKPTLLIITLVSLFVWHASPKYMLL